MKLKVKSKMDNLIVLEDYKKRKVTLPSILVGEAKTLDIYLSKQNKGHIVTLIFLDKLVLDDKFTIPRYLVKGDIKLGKKVEIVKVN